MNGMTVQQEILERLSTLAPAEQQEVLRLARDLSARTQRPWASKMGLLAACGTSVSNDDIAEARREMWGGSVRGIN
jgi:hypothetical protein